MLLPRRTYSLSGRVALVTGAARGIGEATAAALVARGVRVVLTDLDAAGARAAAERLGPLATARGLDVSDHAAFSAVLDAVEREFGPLGVLVNNAGVMPLARIEEEDPATTVSQLEVNLHAVIHGTREAVRRMRPRRRGHIVNVASSAGRTGFPGAATYSATKFGVVGLSEAVRAELRGSGVHITVVLPGLVDTELAAGVPDARTVRRATAPEVAAAIVAALERPRFQVYVPRTIGPLMVLGTLLPWSVRDRAARLLGVDSMLMHADPAVRAAYERRATASAPAAEAAEGAGPQHPTVV